MPKRSRKSGSEDLPQVLKASEVAELLRVSPKTLYEAVQRDEVPGVIRVGRCLRFQRDAVLAWMGGSSC